MDRPGDQSGRGPWECQLIQGLLVTGQSFSGEPGPGVNRFPWEQMLKQPALVWGWGHKHNRNGPERVIAMALY